MIAAGYRAWFGVCTERKSGVGKVCQLITRGQNAPTEQGLLYPCLSAYQPER